MMATAIARSDHSWQRECSVVLLTTMSSSAINHGSALWCPMQTRGRCTPTPPQWVKAADSCAPHTLIHNELQETSMGCERGLFLISLYFWICHQNYSYSDVELLWGGFGCCCWRFDFGSADCLCSSMIRGLDTRRTKGGSLLRPQ